eukprot:1292410-Amphidinium_carterae.1
MVTSFIALAGTVTTCPANQPALSHGWLQTVPWLKSRGLHFNGRRSGIPWSRALASMRRAASYNLYSGRSPAPNGSCTMSVAPR